MTRNRTVSLLPVALAIGFLTGMSYACLLLGRVVFLGWANWSF
jgi:hypothetical protein